jgi:hypothetical protein
METTTNETNGSPGVRNSRGRRFSPQQRRELLKGFEQSGLTQRQFANREKLGLSTLSKWVREQCRSASIPSPPIEFQELIPASPDRIWAAEIVSPQNWTLRLAQKPDVFTLQQIVRALPC